MEHENLSYVQLLQLALQKTEAMLQFASAAEWDKLETVKEERLQILATLSLDELHEAQRQEALSLLDKLLQLNQSLTQQIANLRNQDYIAIKQEQVAQIYQQI